MSHVAISDSMFISMTFPKFSNNVRISEIVVTLVKSIIETDLKWIFRAVHQQHDFGIDGHIDIVLKDGGISGKFIAVQIKTETSILIQHRKYINGIKLCQL